MRVLGFRVWRLAIAVALRDDPRVWHFGLSAAYEVGVFDLTAHVGVVHISVKALLSRDALYG